MAKAANRYQKSPSFATPAVDLDTVTRSGLVAEISAIMIETGK